jgi:hypothetical protein
MSITITNPGVAGITVESDPTALKLTGGTLSGELELPQIGNLLNANLVINSYNDTGAGTNYNHTFTPFDGMFNLAPNGGGLKFPNGTVQTTAGLPLTGGTLTGKLTATPTSGIAGINVGVGGTSAASTTAGDIWITTGGSSLNFRDGTGAWRVLPSLNGSNAFTSNQTISVNNTTTALTVTQTGAGNVLEVRDSNPDSEIFCINQHGKVGIGVAPHNTACLAVDTSGIMFNNGILSSIEIDGAPNIPSGFNASQPEALVRLTINGTSVSVPAFYNT